MRHVYNYIKYKNIVETATSIATAFQQPSSYTQPNLWKFLKIIVIITQLQKSQGICPCNNPYQPNSYPNLKTMAERLRTQLNKLNHSILSHHALSPVLCIVINLTVTSTEGLQQHVLRMCLVCTIYYDLADSQLIAIYAH